MGILDNLRHTLFYNRFSKATPLIEETYQVNLSVTTISIIFNGTLPDDRLAVEQLVQELRDNGHEVYPLGFIDNNSVATSYAFKHFYKKDINWFFIPKHASIDSFLLKNYSVLINLAGRDNLTLHYIAKMTNAEFKIGPLHDKIQMYDLMIQPTASESTEEMIRNIKSVLKSIEYKND